MILNNKIVVGHSLKSDFDCLKLNEDEYRCEWRDISEYPLYLRQFPQRGQKRKLKDLASDFLNAEIQ